MRKYHFGSLVLTAMAALNLIAQWIPQENITAGELRIAFAIYFVGIVIYWKLDELIKKP